MHAAYRSPSEGVKRGRTRPQRGSEAPLEGALELEPGDVFEIVLVIDAFLAVPLAGRKDEMHACGGAELQLARQAHAQAAADAQAARRLVLGEIDLLLRHDAGIEAAHRHRLPGVLLAEEGRAEELEPEWNAPIVDPTAEGHERREPRFGEGEEEIVGTEMVDLERAELGLEPAIPLAALLLRQLILVTREGLVLVDGGLNLALQLHLDIAELD